MHFSCLWYISTSDSIGLCKSSHNNLLICIVNLWKKLLQPKLKDMWSNIYIWFMLWKKTKKQKKTHAHTHTQKVIKNIQNKGKEQLYNCTNKKKKVYKYIFIINKKNKTKKQADQLKHKSYPWLYRFCHEENKTFLANKKYG